MALVHKGPLLLCEGTKADKDLLIQWETSMSAIGLKLNHRGTAGFSPSFHLTGFHLVPIFDPLPFRVT